MKNSKRGDVFIGMLIAQAIILLIIVSSWIVNLNKFIDCDFVAPYKREIVHGVGLVPVISIGTAWITVEDGTNTMTQL